MSIVFYDVEEQAKEADKKIQDLKKLVWTGR